MLNLRQPKELNEYQQSFIDMLGLRQDEELTEYQQGLVGEMQKLNTLPLFISLQPVSNIHLFKIYKPNFAMAKRLRLSEIFETLNKRAVTLLISNSVYHNDPEFEGYEFIFLLGIDEFGIATLSDIEETETERDFRSLILRGGIEGAWA